MTEKTSQTVVKILNNLGYFFSPAHLDYIRYNPHLGFGFQSPSGEETFKIYFDSCCQKYLLIYTHLKTQYTLAIYYARFELNAEFKRYLFTVLNLL